MIFMMAFLPGQKSWASCLFDRECMHDLTADKHDQALEILKRCRNDLKKLQPEEEAKR
ncbi:MAG: hypothetical protein Q7J09_06920 [Methanocalculus sp.]|uniref:hypothetical protein n=1 Tax=Methanocalculus sp. TaxID=2004547 RepID=UPI00272476BF|nr:hypothetical protein [Methanocalculus sp.]MDO9539717.1 hypothetical protein [Methanocalculus sp.]